MLNYGLLVLVLGILWDCGEAEESGTLNMTRLKGREDVRLTCNPEFENAVPWSIELSWRGTESFFTVVHMTDGVTVLLRDGYPHQVDHFPFEDGDVSIRRRPTRTCTILVGGALITSDANVTCRITFYGDENPKELSRSFRAASGRRLWIEGNPKNGAQVAPRICREARCEFDAGDPPVPPDLFSLFVNGKRREVIEAEKWTVIGYFLRDLKNTTTDLHLTCKVNSRKLIEGKYKIEPLQETTAGCYRRLEGVIKVPFRSEENVTAENGNQCLLKALKRYRCGSRCAASFHPPSRTCVTSAPVFELLNLKESSSFIEQTSGEAWMTYHWVSNSIVPDVPPPSGLWLFDSVSKGRNFGAEGRRMDGSFKNVLWIEEGPRGRKLPLKYPLLSEDSSEVRIQNKHNGKHLIDFSRPFTIAMWVKAVNAGNSGGSSDFLLRECGTSSRSSFLYFMQRSTYGRLALQPNYPNHRYHSVRFPSRHNEWRHVAAVYNRPGDVQFYSNGTLVRVEEKITKDSSVPNLNDICLQKDYFLSPPSSVACLSIFQRPLSEAQVAHVMRKCP